MVWFILICGLVNLSCKSANIYKNKSEKRLVFNQFEGHTIKGEKLAQGWRRDSINYGYHKEIYKNPYYLRINNHKNLLGITNDFIFYYYSDGVSINGYHEIREDDMVFYCYFKDGKANGLAQFRYLDGTLSAQGYIDDGEIVGEWVYYRSNSKVDKKSFYEKGKNLPVEMIIYSSDGKPFHHYICKDDKYFEIKS